MKDWKADVQLHAFVTLALDGSELSASRPAALPRPLPPSWGERATGTRYTGGILR
jgi:hypothetical protein